ncbi:MAG: aldo/keto reductase [Bacteroidota bacterium]
MSNNDFNRRTFLKTSLLGTAGALFTNKMTGSESIKSIHAEGKNGKVVKRKLGNTDIEVPVVSFGVMRADNPNLIKAAMDNTDIEHFDTAHGYQDGNNEKMLGEVLKDYSRDSFTIATKVGSREKKEFLESLDTSLERLQMDHVDILYSHAVSSRDDVMSEEVQDALKTAKSQGKTRYIGVSTHSNEPDVIEAVIEAGIHDVILTSYNFRQDHKDEMTRLIEEASKAGIGIVAMKTQAGGDLEKDSETKMPNQAALKWALKNPHVHTAIPGIITYDELEENVAVMNDLDLNQEEEDFLYAASFEEGLYCNGCQECTKTCRKNLPIPDMMRAYMYAHGYREVKKAKDELVAHGIQDNPCKDCTDDCTVKCKKGFKVPQKIADITRVAQVPDEFLV